MQPDRWVAGPAQVPKAPIEFNDIGANRFAYKTQRISVTPYWTTSRLSRLDRTDTVRQLEANSEVRCTEIAAC
jgi:hypothetical protein